MIMIIIQLLCWARHCCQCRMCIISFSSHQMWVVISTSQRRWLRQREIIWFASSPVSKRRSWDSISDSLTPGSSLSSDKRLNLGASLSHQHILEEALRRSFQKCPAYQLTFANALSLPALKLIFSEQQQTSDVLERALKITSWLHSKNENELRVREVDHLALLDL